MARIDFKPKRGMIIDIDLNPVRGSETGKIRPCIVVTNDVYNNILSVIQVVPITSWTDKKARVKTNVTEMIGFKAPYFRTALSIHFRQ